MAITQLTSNGVSKTPDIYDNRIVWIENGKEVVLYDGNSINKLPETGNNSVINPQLSETGILWNGYINGWQIFFYDNNNINQLTTDPYIFDEKLSGNRIAWRSAPEYSSIGDLYEVYVYDSSTQTTVQLTDNDSGESSVDISGQNVVWKGSGNTVFLNDGFNTTQLTTNGVNPHVSGDLVAWEAYSGGKKSEIYLYDAGVTTQIVNSNDSVSIQGFFDGNLVWGEWIGNDWELFRFDGINTYQVTNNDINDTLNPNSTVNSYSMYSAAAVDGSGDNLVWSSYVDDNWEIFYYDGTETIRVTNNDIDDLNPKISGDTVVWSTSGATSDVFMFEPGSGNVGNITGTDGDDRLFATDGSYVDGGAGFDTLVVDYTDRRNDLNLFFGSSLIPESYRSIDGSLQVIEPETGNSSRIDFKSIESFEITGGQGNDNLELQFRNITDDTINGGAGDDFIFTGQGIDSVDGGVGSDRLELNFYNSQNGVNSSLTNDNIGEYNDGENSVSFSNIESILVTGSSYDDVLVALDADSATDEFETPISSYIDGREGFDTLVADYSDRRQSLGFRLNSSFLELYSRESYSPETGSIDTLIGSINFNNIESFEITGGRSDDTFDFGFDNFSDDMVNGGAGDDYFINLGQGRDSVDGGAGSDRLSLDFSNSQNGVYSSLTDSSGGEYDDGTNSVTFSNIELLEVTGSNYSDVLVAIDGSNYDNSPAIYDGGEGLDTLIVDYSNRRVDLELTLDNSVVLRVFSPDSNRSSGFEAYNIEGFEITSGRGNDNLDLTSGNFTDDTVDAGAGDDFISTSQGKDSVDGGTGTDKLSLDFSNSQNGVDSSLSDSDSGEYDDGINSVAFSNIESVDVIGSSYDDMLVATDAGSTSNYSDPTLATSYIDGGEGFDTLVADYSERRQRFDLVLNYNSLVLYSSEFYFSETSSNNRLIDFNNIESFEITGGRSDDTFDLGADNFSNDTVNGGAGDDYFINLGQGRDSVDGGAGIDRLRLDYSDSFNSITSTISNSTSGEYSDGENSVSFSNIEILEVTGSSYDDVLVATNAGTTNNYYDPLTASYYPPASYINGGDGVDTVKFAQTLAEAGEISTDDGFINIGSKHSLFDVEFIEFSNARLELAPTISLGNYETTIAEGNISSTFDFNLSNPTIQDVAIDVTAYSSSAEAGIDFVEPSQLIIEAGESSGTLALEILGDTIAEEDEQITLDFTIASGGTFASGNISETAVVNVLDKDTFTTDEDVTLTITAAELLSNNTEGWSLSGVNNSVNGTAIVNGEGNIEFTPAVNFNGTASFDYTATNGAENTTASMEVMVTPINDAPAVANPISDQTADEDSQFSFVVPEGTFDDADGDVLTYSATLADDSPLPSWLNFDPTSETFSGTPDAEDVGTISLKVIASDDTESVSDEFNLTVNNAKNVATTTLVNAGGNAYTDSLNQQWSASQGFSGGLNYTTQNAISNTENDPLYQTELYGTNFAYSTAIANGSYDVTLKFAELYFDRAGKRVFDVSLENQLILDDFDIFAEAGGKNIALDKTFSVGVTDGTLDLEFISSVNKAKISAISIQPSTFV